MYHFKIIFLKKQALESLEILLRKNEQFVESANDIEFAQILEDTIGGIDPKEHPEINKIANICLAILKKGVPTDCKIKEEGHDNKDEDDEEEDGNDDDEMLEALPLEAKNFLMAGKIMAV